MHSHRAVRFPASRGFTLVELLVVIGVIAVLVAITLHAASAIKDSARRGAEISAARSLAQAWISYATDNRGAVLPGYAEGFGANDQFGNPIETETVPVAAKRWPWRLAGYLGHDIEAGSSTLNIYSLRLKRDSRFALVAHR